MKLLTHEKELDAQASLIVTNKRLIQERKEFGKRTHKEIPLNKITSISFEYELNIGLLIAGIVLTLLGLFLIFLESHYTQTWSFVLVFGMVLLIITLLLKKEYVEFNSNRLKIREENREIEKFVDTVREEIYKNNVCI
ncbi:MAG: PH domain-containing protein [Candidatus Aenigmarchaeota archaeon]|nr:PH domain-containing protein [Candidatus Aenigmarchaeota archaeon]